jgi:histone H3/H4
MKGRIYGGVEDDSFNYGDSDICWSEHDDGERSFSDYVDQIQALEGTFRGFLDELSAFDPELNSKRIAFELEETALAKIRVEQRDTRTIINRQEFSLLCHNIMQDYRSDYCISDEALDALQTAAESRVIEVFQKANLVAIHAGRTCIERDFHVPGALEMCQPLSRRPYSTRDAVKQIT